MCCYGDCSAPELTATEHHGAAPLQTPPLISQHSRTALRHVCAGHITPASGHPEVTALMPRWALQAQQTSGLVSTGLCRPSRQDGDTMKRRLQKAVMWRFSNISPGLGRSNEEVRPMSPPWAFGLTIRTCRSPTEKGRNDTVGLLSPRKQCALESWPLEKSQTARSHAHRTPGHCGCSSSPFSQVRLQTWSSLPLKAPGLGDQR